MRLLAAALLFFVLSAHADQYVGVTAVSVQDLKDDCQNPVLKPFAEHRLAACFSYFVGVKTMAHENAPTTLCKRQISETNAIAFYDLIIAIANDKETRLYSAGQAASFAFKVMAPACR